jgi:hypothetical protein
MPNGYYLPYVASSEEPYWRFGFGQIKKKPDGTIPQAGFSTCKEFQMKREHTRAPIWVAWEGSS